MREAFHGELALLRDQLAWMCELAAEAMRRGTRAVLDRDLTLAERVVAADTEMDTACAMCEHQAHSLLALQAPVAGDLRAIVAAVYCADNLERMGDLAAHVADVARFSHPEAAVPVALHNTVADLSAMTVGMTERVRELIVGGAAMGFEELRHADDAVDAQCARTMATLTSGSWPHGVRMATNVALLIRFYERYADHAVATARRLDFAVTGTLPR